MDNNDSEDDEEFFVDRIDDLQEETLVERTTNQQYEESTKRKKKFSPNYNVSGVIRVELNELTQNSLGIQVGPDITGENPWKMVKKELLYDNMQVLGDDSIFTQFKPDIDMYEEDELLFGYILDELTDTDDYYVCLTTEAKKHCETQAEKYLKKQARKLEKSVFKVPNPWKSLGSEQEVDENLVKNSRPLIRVEVKTKYPTQFQPDRFQDRHTDAARDGYTELVATRIVFDNIVKKRIDAAVQANPEKNSSEAQTIPKFPQNVWTQCENENDMVIPSIYDEKEKPNESETEDPVQNMPEPTETPKVDTHQGKKLKIVERDLTAEHLKEFVDEKTPDFINLLTFNSAIDIYNVDYPDLAVSDQQKVYENAEFKEMMCLIDIRAKDKFIVSSSWHPTMSGIVAVAYADFTNCIIESSKRPTDEVHRAVYGKNPVLIWSTSDSLRPMLYLECNREITELSFCPFDDNILIGGCINGQIIIWDLTDKLYNSEVFEVLTKIQEKNRIALNLEMGWVKNVNKQPVIRPVASSDLAFDHIAPVTDILWLSPNYEIKKNGKMVYNGEEEKNTLQFLSSAEGGNILVWDLKNYFPITADEIKIENASRVENFPTTLTQKASRFSVLDGIFRPIYKIIVTNTDPSPEPLSGMEFEYPIVSKFKRPHIVFEDNIMDDKVNQPGDIVLPVILTSTMTGKFMKVTWKGNLIESEDKVTTENCSILSESKVHDGSILTVVRNPFCPEIVATIGGRVFALWSTNLQNTPLMWKRMKYNLTDAAWSEYIASQIFVTTEEGSIDIWDFLQRSDLPIITQNVSGKMLTGIFMQPFLQKNHLFGVADYKGSMRIFSYTKAFMQVTGNHLKETRRFFERELEIKNGFQKWEHNWSIKHSDILEKRKKLEESAIRDKEVKAKLAAKKEREKKELAEETLQLQKNRVIGAEEKWRKLQWQYIEKTLEEKKKLNKRELMKQVKPLRELEAQKRERIKKQIEMLNNRKKIFDESVTILFPEAAPQPPIVKHVIPIEEVKATKKKYIDEYNSIAEEAAKLIDTNPYQYEFNWQKTIMDGKERRRNMDVRSSVIKIKNERLENALKKENIVINPENINILKDKIF